MKAFLEVSLVSLTIKVRTVFEISEKTRQFHCTGLLHCVKLVHLEGKNLICFFKNLFQKSIKLVLHFKSSNSAKLLLELKHSKKPYICDHQGPNVYRQVKNLQAVSKKDPSVVFLPFLTYQCKMIVHKSVARSNFSFINT